MSEEITTPADDPEEPVSPAADEDESADPGAEESADTEDKPEADESEDEEDVPAEGSSPTFEKLLKKYGGDREKMAQAIFEQYNSTARTHEEIQTLKQMLEELKGSKEREQNIDEAINEDPNVKDIQTEMASMKEEAAQMRDLQQKLTIDYRKTETEIAKLEAKIEEADESRVYALSQQLEKKQRELERIQDKLESNSNRYRNMEKDWKSNQRRLKEAEAQARSRVERERADAIRTQHEATVARREFNDTLRAEAQRFGIDPSSKSYKFINDSFRTQISAHINELVKRGVTEQIDIPAAVKFLMKEYAEASQLKPKITRLSEAKKELSTRTEAKVVPEGERRAAPKASKDASYWRDRAKRLMP